MFATEVFDRSISVCCWCWERWRSSRQRRQGSKHDGQILISTWEILGLHYITEQLTAQVKPRNMTGGHIGISFLRNGW